MIEVLTDHSQTLTTIPWQAKKMGFKWSIDKTGNAEWKIVLWKEAPMCRVDTNPRAFKMPTHKMGEVVIEPNQFFMAMTATSIEQYPVETMPDASAK